MRILVVDVAADSGGALTILNQYYGIFSADTKNEYIFCVSVAPVAPAGNISVERFPWVKKSWFHRLWFDYVVCRRIIKKYRADRIISLQNTLVPAVRLPQTLYLHQPLPFCTYKFSFFENKKFWIYQNIIGRLIKKSVRKAEKIIVQTEWMRQALVEQCGVAEGKIEKLPPAVSVDVECRFDGDHWQRLFFYPASNLSYKNHKVIFQAVLLLKQQGITDFQVVFTLTPSTLPKDCAALYEELRDIIQLAGNMSHSRVMALYGSSVLLFPSYIETYGLPLLEASACKSPIIASDTPFSREILADYEYVDFFDAFSAEALKNLMQKYLSC
jgi:glycosyltransferase involved in cell wall biosynthesis